MKRGDLVTVALQDSHGETGLQHRSFAMLDRITIATREKIGRPIGQAGDATMLEINRALSVFLGLA